MSTLARAVRITTPGGPEVLKLGEIEVRDPGPGEVLVEVAAAGLNRADLLQRMGVYPAPAGIAPDVPGLEFAGHVAKLGEDVSRVKVGQAVMGITGGAAMATHLVAHEAELIPVPDGMDIRQAAAIPEAFVTAHDAMFTQADLRMGQTALIHAVASGVGTAALQLCLAAGVTPVGTSRSPDKLARCEKLGLEHRICTEDGTFAKALQALPVSAPGVVLYTIGAKYLVENLKAVAPRGCIVVIELLGGVKGELGLGLLVSKRVRLMGSVLRSRGLDEKIQVAQAFREQVVPLFHAGKLSPVVDALLPMAEVGDAHARLATNEVFGKLVLHW